MRYFGMKLERVAGPMAERLDGEGVTLGQQLAARRQVEAFAMPLIDVVGPIRTDLATRLGRADRIITDLGVAFRVRIDRGTEMPRQHLRAKTDPKIRFLVAQRHADPVDLAAHEVLIVVGTLRAAKNGRAGMLVHRFRQRISETRTPNVERIAELRQGLADPPGRGMLLMKNKQDWLQHGSIREMTDAD